jgi:hypothetical protein
MNSWNFATKPHALKEDSHVRTETFLINLMLLKGVTCKNHDIWGYSPNFQKQAMKTFYLGLDRVQVVGSVVRVQ